MSTEPAAAQVVFAASGCAPNASTWWSSHVTCLAPNEVGDTLAGGFAPLALIWLMTAVLLQSRELRAQREELALTRDEMREARAVLGAQKEAMDAQVAEARRNVEFIGKQTEFLREDRDKSKRDAADAEIDIDLGRVVEKFAETAGKNLIATKFHVRLGPGVIGSAVVKFREREHIYYVLQTIEQYTEERSTSFDKFCSLAPDVLEEQLNCKLSGLAEVRDLGKVVTDRMQKTELSSRKREEFTY